MVVLGLIPARAGSKGIPGKNERLLAGRTLVERAADAARRSETIDRIVLTTDSDEIVEIGRKLGLDIVFRPTELAQDNSPMFPVIEHALDAVEVDGWSCDAVALLQPTQPLRRPEHIRDAARILTETGASSVVSVVEIPLHFAPQYAMRLVEDKLESYLAEGAAVTRRQQVEPAYSRDGTIYLSRRETIRGGDLYGAECRPLLVPASESVNLDTAEDWKRAEMLLTE
jgi:CMP-N-acetylneuraminic acid synthetase